MVPSFPLSWQIHLRFILSFFFLNLKLGCIFVRLYNNVSCLVHGKCRTKIHLYSSNLAFYSRYMSHINFSPSFWTSSYLLQDIPVCSGQENIKYGLVWTSLRISFFFIASFSLVQLKTANMSSITSSVWIVVEITCKKQRTQELDAVYIFSTSSGTALVKIFWVYNSQKGTAV